MKKLIFATLSCLVVFAGFTQTTDSIYSENKINGVWQKSGLEIFTRDASSCAINSSLSMVWNESTQSWVNSFFSTYTYGDATLSSVVVTQSWDAFNNQWINSSRSVLLLVDGVSKRTFLYQLWDAASGSWIDNYRITENMDSKGRATVSEFNLYSNNEWQKVQRSQIFYEDDRLDKTIFQMWSGTGWANNSKTTYNYTGRGTTLDYLWDNGNQAWTLFRRAFNDYRDNTTLAEKSWGQIISGSEWQNAFRANATFNDQNLLLSNFQQIWDAGIRSWINSARMKLDYYEDGSQYHFQFEVWDAATNSWSSGYRATNTDISCLQGIQVVPVSVIGDRTAVLQQTGKENKLLHRMPETKAGSTNRIQRTFNPLAGNASNLVYDFSFGGSDSKPEQHAFELIISSGAGPKAVSSKLSEPVVTNKKGFLISPNPARNYFDINLAGKTPTGDIMLKLSDVSGKLILARKVNTGLQRIDLPSLQKGLYVVTIISGKEVQTQKLVIE